jgi:hypothetical protein
VVFFSFILAFDLISKMFWRTTLAASLLAWRVHAGVGALVAEGMARRSTADLERMMSFAAEEATVARSYPQVLSKRQQQQQQQQGGQRPAAGLPRVTDAGVVLNPDGTINMTAWEEIANTACNEALLNLPLASNPSGTCICYNLPALNTDNGAFEADLRLYQLSTPNAEFAGIPPENIQVGIMYTGASVSPVSQQTAQRLVQRDSEEDLFARQAPATPPPANMGLRLLQTYLFVGQIDSAKMKAEMSM